MSRKCQEDIPLQFLTKAVVALNLLLQQDTKTLQDSAPRPVKRVASMCSSSSGQRTSPVTRRSMRELVSLERVEASIDNLENIPLTNPFTM